MTTTLITGANKGIGYTATDLNAGTGTQTVEQGAAILVAMAQTGPDGPTGQFFDGNGLIPW